MANAHAQYVLVCEPREGAPRYFVALDAALGLFWECSCDLREARKFATRTAARDCMWQAGKHRQGWRVIKLPRVEAREARP